MHRIIAFAAGALLLAGCSSSDGSGDRTGGERQRCLRSTDCRVPTPLCDEGFCVACTETAHCTAARPLCIEGVCMGAACTDDIDCTADAALCDAGLCVACRSSADCDGTDGCRADGSCGSCVADADCGAGRDCLDGHCIEAAPGPRLVVVLDRSGSMVTCAPGVAGDGRCDSDADGRVDMDGGSRWDMIRAALADPRWLPASAELGLVVTGAAGSDSACREPASLVEPGSSRDAFGSAWTDPLLVDPDGGTPTVAALALAGERIGAGTGTRVVLITDGQPNCNVGHPMPCICANDAGCPTECGFRSKPIAVSGASRSLIPDRSRSPIPGKAIGRPGDADHRFRPWRSGVPAMPITDSGDGDR